jgi:hypothetical protein
MSAYIGRTYTMTVSGTVSRRERCCHCSTAFEYEICRNGMGNGHSPFLLLNSGAKQTAERRARKALQRAFVGAVEPVHCPTCGMYQPEMVPELERRFGVRFDPNEYAAERVTIPFNVIWKKMVEAYERFVRTRGPCKTPFEGAASSCEAQGPESPLMDRVGHDRCWVCRPRAPVDPRRA